MIDEKTLALELKKLMLDLAKNPPQEDLEIKEAYNQGRKDAIDEIHKLLRDAGEVEHPNTGLCTAHSEWADWLESKLLRT